MKQPNVPMNHPITTCRHKVDRKKFDSGWDRIWGKPPDDEAILKRLRDIEEREERSWDTLDLTKDD